MSRASKPKRFSWNGGAAPRNADLVIADLGDANTPEGEWIFKRYQIVDRRRTLQSISRHGERVVLENQPRRWYRVRGVLFE